MEGAPPPPPPPVATISPPLKAAAGSSSSSKKRRLPNPKELIKHYESQGMETQEASLKVIEDLQKILFRVVTSSSRPGAAKGRNSSEPDVVNSRLMRLEMKLDSKPGYPQTLAIGVASGAVFRGIETVFPRILSAVADIWNVVRRSTSGSNPRP